MSSIEKALQVAKADPSKGHVFYDAFLNADLIIPVRAMEDRKDEPSRPPARKLGTQEKFYPLFLTIKETKLVPVFDSIERMNHWSQGNPLDHIEVRAHLFLTTLHQDVGVALNPGSNASHAFFPPDLERLRKAIKPVKKSDKH